MNRFATEFEASAIARKLLSFELSFVVAGFGKSGTSTLCAMLAQHSRIGFSSPKEPQFFNRVDYEQHWDDYLAAFPPSNTGLVYGEGSTFYSSFQWERNARDALLKYFPDIKLIFIARDPFQRIESSYREFHHSGPAFGIDAPFGIANALAAFPALIEDSRYWTRINYYREKIPDERILVVFFEDLLRDHAAVIERCFAHLGVDPTTAIEAFPHENASATKYYDSKLLRRLRNTEIIGPALSKLSIPTQNRWLPRLGLRRRFDHAIAWDRVSVQYVTETLADDTRQFLRFYHKPENYWQTFSHQTRIVG